MEIKINYLIEGAKQAKGLVVLIDVFRAFSTAAYVLANGAKKIITIGDLDYALKLKKENPDFILMGERNYLPLEGFDYGNSPFRISKIDFTGKTIIMTTSSGTQGIVNATLAEERLIGSFVNASATMNYIKEKNPSVVTFVALGAGGITRRDEDDLFAEYCKALLENKPANFLKIKEHLRTYKSALKFFNKAKFDSEDFEFCLDLDKFDFVMKIIKTDFGPAIVKHE